MDTPSDFRIRFAEKGLEEVERSLANVKIQGRKELLKEVGKLRSEIQVIKYSYISFDDLAGFESTLKISETSKEIAERILNAEIDFHRFNAEYWLDYLTSLPDLFKRGEISKACEAIRYFSGEIISAVKISENLWICSFNWGRKMSIVTNSNEFTTGNAVVSYLPPKQFGNAVSQGMFVSAQLDKKGELEHSEILSIVDRLGEVEAILLGMI